VKQCENFMVVGCPFKCASSTAKGFRQLRDHITHDCANESLNCKACGFETFRHYANVGPLHPKGHNCMRDNPTSGLLLKNMRNIVRKINSREMSNLETELMLYKGPIPYRCVPNEDEPEGFFNIEQKMNMTDELVECCK